MSPGFRNFFGPAAGRKSGFPQKKDSHPAEKAPQSVKTGAIFHFPQNFSTPCGKQRGKNSGFFRLTKRLFRVCGAPQHGTPGGKNPPHEKSARHRAQLRRVSKNRATWATGGRPRWVSKMPRITGTKNATAACFWWAFLAGLIRHPVWRFRRSRSQNRAQNENGRDGLYSLASFQNPVAGQ